MSESEIKAASVSTSLSDNPVLVQASTEKAAAETAALNSKQDAAIPDKTPPALKGEALDEPVKTSDDLSKRVAPDNTDAPIPSMDDFAAVKEGAIPQFKGEKKNEEVKKTDEGKAKKEDKVEAKIDEQVTQQETQQRVQRDYSGLSEEETAALKKTSNESFNYLKPILLERKKLSEVIAKKDTEIANLKVGKQIMPETYYEHPDAFVLSPEYNTAQSTLQTLSFVQNHWEQQLARIEKGEPWQSLLVDEKTGQFRYSQAQEPTVESKFQIMKYFQNTNSELSNAQKNLLNLKESFQGRHKEAAGVITKAIADHLNMYDDPKHPMRPLVEHFTNAIPVEFRNSPLAPLVARTTTAMLQFKKAYETAINEIAELKKNGNGATRISAAKAAAGPNESDVENAGTGDGKPIAQEVTMDDFEKVKYS